MSKPKNEAYLAKFVHPTYVEDEAKIESISMYKRSLPKRIAYWFFFLVTGGFLFLLQKWSVAIRLRIKNSKTTDVKEADRLIITGIGNKPQPIIYP